MSDLQSRDKDQILKSVPFRGLIPEIQNCLLENHGMGIVLAH